MLIAQLLHFVLSHWWTAFLLTLAIEIPLFVLLTRGTVPSWRAAIAGALCSCITHPLLWFVWRRVITDYFTYVVTGELIVAALESLIFFAIARPVRLLRAIGTAFVANGTSYGAGLIIGMILRSLISR